MGDIKRININIDTKKENKLGATKRIITDNEIWKNYEGKLSIDNQYDYIKQLYDDNIKNIDICNVIHKQIKQKISGYRNQDTIKKILNIEKLITTKYAFKLLYESNLNCYYCKENVSILYDTVREPKQWTLDRIDNDIGHYSDNVVIACLSCNLHRKTMYHERFLFTKQLNIIKKE
jgi:hypothetical protein